MMFSSRREGCSVLSQTKCRSVRSRDTGIVEVCCAMALSAGVMLSVVGCKDNGTVQAASSGTSVEPPLKAKVHTVQLEKWPRIVRVQGSLLSDETAVVGSKVAGRVERVNVDIGSVVHPNDELVSLETREFDLRVQQAEAQLEQARATLGLKPGSTSDAVDPVKIPMVVREEAVWHEAKANLERIVSLDTKAISVEERGRREAAVAVAEARYRSALNDVDTQTAAVGMRRAELGLARQMRQDAVICAPFEGVVQQRHVAPGAYLQIGQAVVTLVRANPLRFHGGVPEREALFIRPGQRVEVSVEGKTELYPGTVTRISPALDMTNRSLIVEVDLPNPESKLKIGLFAEADIVIEPDAKAVAVPTTAVREFAGVEKAWAVRKGQAVEQVVQTGRRLADRVEILQGLSVGDVVLVDARRGRLGPVVVENGEPSKDAGK